MQGAVKRKLILIDQIPELLQEWANMYGFQLPSTVFIQNIIKQTIRNIRMHFQCEVVHISSRDIIHFAELVDNNHIAIFIAPEIFLKVKEILKIRGQTYMDFKVSRTRLPIIDSGFFPGHGMLLGEAKSIMEQLTSIKQKAGLKSCVLFDDSITTGKTISEITSLFNSYGLTIARWAPISCFLSEENLAKKQISSPTQVFLNNCVGIEMKDFLDITGSGAAYPMGMQKQREKISQIIKIIQSKSKGRVRELEKEGIHVNNMEQFEIKIKKIDSLQFPENKDLISIIQCLKISKVNALLVSPGRLSYLWPGYKSSQWNISDSEWESFSAKQHKLSMDLYRAIEARSKRKVKVCHVPIYSEIFLNQDGLLCDYLLKISSVEQGIKDAI